MITSQSDFHPMLGHVIDGMTIYADNGDTLTLRANMRGWIVDTPQGSSDPMPSAAEVERYILSYGY